MFHNSAKCGGIYIKDCHGEKRNYPGKTDDSLCDSAARGLITTGVIFLLRKICIIAIVLTVLLLLMMPSGATPSEVVLDQQVELAVPGSFALFDSDRNQQPDKLQFTINLNSYQEGDFIVVGNLEGMRGSNWVALGTTVIPYRWKPDHQTIQLFFHTDSIRKYRISGPYRVSISLKSGDWELPAQVAGFSPKYAWQQFKDDVAAANGSVNSISVAKRMVEAWAEIQKVKLGNLVDASYDYDRWQLDYQARNSDQIIRMQVSPRGAVSVLRIRPGESESRAE